MTVESTLQILEFLFGPGCIAVFWVWLKNRETRKATASKERDDTYKQMYDNLSGTLIDLQNENIKLYKAVRNLNRTIQKAVTCPHYSGCPMLSELQEPAGGGAGGDAATAAAATTHVRPARQPGAQRSKKNRRMARDDPHEPGEPAGADGQCL